MSETITNDDDGVLLQCKCMIKKKQYTVTLTSTQLSWHITDGGKQKDLQCFGVVDLLSVNVQKNPSNDGSGVDAVNVTFVKQGKNLQLKRCCVVFTCADSQLATQLHKLIGDVIANNKQKPRKLLVFINPISGRSKGRSVYEQKVAPIFKDAGIETEVIVTERAHHTEEILATYDIKSISGLVIVGGDGLYHEAVNGVMKRLAKDRGLDVNDPNTALPDIDLPMGLIPCGTGNAIAYCCYGSYDVVTAALSVAIGYQTKNSMVAVHSGGQLLAYSSLLVGYGMWSDMSHVRETSRDQGMLRTLIATCNQMFIQPMRRLNVTIQTVNVQEETKGEAPCGTNIDAKNNVVKPTIESGVVDTKDIEVVTGYDNSASVDDKDISNSSRISITKEPIIGSIIYLNLPNTVKGVIPATQSSLTMARMLLSKPAGRMKIVSLVYQMIRLNFEEINRREDIVMLPGQEWSVKLDELSEPNSENWQLEHLMNIDGEIFKLSQPEYQAKLFPGKITLFSNMPYSTGRDPETK